MGAKTNGDFKNGSKGSKKASDKQKPLENKGENENLSELDSNENEPLYVKSETESIEQQRVLALPKGDYSLFHLEKLDNILFRATEIRIVDGTIADFETIGEDIFAVLKHKMHRRIFETAQSRFVAEKKDEHADINKASDEV